jgi:hypothetical protein
MAEDMTYEPVQTVAQLAARVQELEREVSELRMVLDLIDRRAGPADRTCHQPGIKLSEAARRELADMGKIDHDWKRVQP